MAEKAKKVVGTGTLSVTVISASNIYGGAKAESYVVLTSSFNKQRFKSKMIKKNPNPSFAQEFNFFTSSPDGIVTVELFAPKFMKDDLIGKCIIPTASLASGVPEEKSYDLTNEPKKKNRC